MTKYRVNIETGYVEFTELDKAEAFYAEAGISSIEPIEFEIPNTPVEI